MAPIVIIPPAPSPHTARAAMKLPMDCASAHHAVDPANTAMVTRYSGLRPTVSDKLPTSGWNAVAVSRKAVVSQDATAIGQFYWYS
ncbi:hypothetical protein RRF57_005639 [Xylaria bambusicola]|uniref:Uncharacterized protein n=1 Tax=Xylaria bambusicola TaxID=326684 RepID=A0AAN7UCZ3_9PEZI